MAMITVLLPGATETTLMDESELHKLEGGFENDNEIASYVQYHLKTSGELVHRSASVYLKKAIFADGAAASIG